MNSAILSPSHDDVIMLPDSSSSQGAGGQQQVVRVRGWAYSGV